MHKIDRELLECFNAPKFNNSFMISFEGIEGAGKSTHIHRAKELLESHGYRVILTREPGGTKFGEKLREAILGSDTPLDPIAEAHLFASSRAQLLKEVTLKELAVPNTVVIYDRFIDSSIAYQGVARALGPQTILEVHKHAPLNTVPNLTVYIRISLETSHERQRIRNQEKDYFESENSEFYKKLIAGYEFSAEHFPSRVQAVNGEGTMDEVFEEIREKILALIQKEGA